MLKLKDGTPIAWAFIGNSPWTRLIDSSTHSEAGLDGSLISLHCEVSQFYINTSFFIQSDNIKQNGYRRRGIAKLLAAKLLRQTGIEFSNDKYAGHEWSSADVAPDNEGSRAMCKSLNATPHWSISW